MEEPIKIEETNPAKVSLQIFIDEVVELANRNGVTFVGGFIDKHDYGVYNNFTGEISDETLTGFQECIQELNNHIMVASFSNGRDLAQRLQKRKEEIGVKDDKADFLQQQEEDMKEEPQLGTDGLPLLGDHE